jgi:hypothetical protein
MVAQASTVEDIAPQFSAADDEAPPAGFEQASGDLVGYWESASPPSRQSEEKHGSSPVLFTPLWVTLSDSDLDNKKTSTLLHGRLEKDCLLRSANKEEGYKVFPKGSMFGIWTKPGMKPLQGLASAVVWMRNGIEVRKGEIQYFKEIGKPSPMVLFDIRNQGKGQKLPIREDRRDQSLPQKLRDERARVAQDMGDIPF